MEYTEMIFEAIKKGELGSLLRGDEGYKLETSQYAPGTEPTDIGKVLSKGIYKAYNVQTNIKESLESVLLCMLGETDFDVYIVVLYIMSQLFKEKNGLSPFKMDMSFILPKLKQEIHKRSDGIMNGVKYPNGFIKKSAWDEFERFNLVCKEEYGIELF